MEIKNLAAVPFEQIMDCFTQAFQNYFVPISTDSNYYKERLRIAKVDYARSYGMFDQQHLVGFILLGIDSRWGHKVAFNTGTGVLPKYRGKRIVKQLYNHALPILKKEGVTKHALEVIKENEVAIRAYESIGFKIVKSFECFSGSIDIGDTFSGKLEKVEHQDLEWQQLPNQKHYSWDHHKNALEEADYTYYILSKKEEEQGYFILNENSGYVAQFELLENATIDWNNLLAAIRSVSPNIKINNVDEALQDKLNALKSANLENTIGQYEMEMTPI